MGLIDKDNGKLCLSQAKPGFQFMHVFKIWCYKAITTG